MKFIELIEKAGICSSGIIKIKREDVSASTLDDIRNNFCIYMIECNDEIVYIGKSENIIHRLRQHKYKLNFDYVYIGCMEEECTYRDTLFMESYLIGIAEPVLNFSDFTRKTFASKDIEYLKNNISYIGA